jgi:hypothetical protein
LCASSWIINPVPVAIRTIGRYDKNRENPEKPCQAKAKLITTQAMKICNSSFFVSFIKK